MSTKLRLDPELAAVVARAREQLDSSDQLGDRGSGPVDSSLPSEAREVLRKWIDEGGYRDAVALVVADDPELAIQ